MNLYKWCTAKSYIYIYIYIYILVIDNAHVLDNPSRFSKTVLERV